MNKIQDKVAEVELAYRPKVKQRTKLTSSEDCYKYLLDRCFDEATINHHEEFKCIFLGNSLQVLGWSTISKGGLNETLVDVRVVLQYALLMNASLIVCGHNHPSGSMRPSKDDDRLTERLKKACELLSIKMLDHLVVTNETYYSYNDEGRL